jgi:hypothetical protein
MTALPRVEDSYWLTTLTRVAQDGTEIISRRLEGHDQGLGQWYTG